MVNKMGPLALFSEIRISSYYKDEDFPFYRSVLLVNGSVPFRGLIITPQVKSHHVPTL
jgi:hypothetical protein